MRSLLPGFPDSPLFEAIFIDLLPANARDAAVKHDLLEDMAEAADKVLAEAPLASTVSVVSSREEDDLALAQLAKAPTSAKKKDPSLCYVHARYGRGAYRCYSPSTCQMKDVIVKPPSTSAPGKANAGRR